MLPFVLPNVTDTLGSLDYIGLYVVLHHLLAYLPRPAFEASYSKRDARGAMLFALCFFEAGLLTSALAKYSSVFMLGRALVGVGSAGITAGMSHAQSCVGERTWFNHKSVTVLVEAITTIAGPL